MQDKNSSTVMDSEHALNHGYMSEAKCEKAETL